MKRTFAAAGLLLLGGCNFFIDPDSVPLPAARLTIIKSGSGIGLVTSDPPGITCGSECTAPFPPGTHVTLHASTTNGSESFFTGFSNGGCEGALPDCTFRISRAIEVAATFRAMDSNLIFVSSGPFSMTLGSATAYDTSCNTRATEAGINDASGTGYVAAVSDAASLFTDRLGGSARGWVRMDGRPFADTQSSLFLDNVVFNAVKYDEHGNGVPAATAYFTGTNPDGTLARSDTCNNWTRSGGATAIGGFADGGPFAWIAGARGDCGAGDIRILCMGKTKDSAVSPAPRAGRKVWLTNTPFTVGGGTTPDQLCNAQKPAGVTAAVALISTTRRQARFLLEASASYIRPDGTLVGTGDTIGFRGPLLSGIWQSADLVYGHMGEPGWVWTGSSFPNTPGDPVGSCGDWVDPTQTAGRIGSSIFTNNWFWNVGTHPCNDSSGAGGGALYCVQTAP